jgi:hypothetical protein
MAVDDFEAVASLGMQLLALQQESAQLPLSEEDYLTLAARHAALVKSVHDKCTDLAEAEDYSAVTDLGVKLRELRLVVPPVIDSSTATIAGNPLLCAGCCILSNVYSFLYHALV